MQPMPPNHENAPAEQPDAIHNPELDIPVEQLVEPSAVRAGERIEAWYAQLEPRLGVYLTDPNVVLTLADARGQTDFSVDEPQPGDEAAILALNEASLPLGVVFHVKQYEKASTGDVVLNVGVYSFAGLERGSNETRLPGIPRFNPHDEHADIKDWAQTAVDGVKAAAEHGQLPPEVLEGENYHHVVFGVAKGYPDNAIMASILEKPPVGDEPVATKHTRVPYADYYHCAEPGYVYDPKDEAEVAAHTAQWGKILEEYYQSPQHEAMRSDPDFMRYRMQT